MRRFRSGPLPARPSEVTGDNPPPILPDVPTVCGIGRCPATWPVIHYGMVERPGRQRPIVDRFNAELKRRAQSEINVARGIEDEGGGDELVGSRSAAADIARRTEETKWGRWYASSGCGRSDLHTVMPALVTGRHVLKT